MASRSAESEPLFVSCKSEPKDVGDDRATSQRRPSVVDFESTDAKHENAMSTPSTSDIFRNISDLRCDVCAKYYTTKTNLYQHKRRVHIDKFAFKCKTCGKAFSTVYQLSGHVELKHLGKQLTNCRICDETFAATRSLHKHMRTHKRSFKCDICGKSYVTNSKLQYHMIYHMDEQEMEKHCRKCTICGKILKKHKFSTHMHTHTRAYDCDLCGKSFATKIYIKQHIKNHSNVQKFPCTICDKSFTMKQCQMRHIRDHTKTLPCTMCDKMFARKGTLDSHMLVVHFRKREVRTEKRKYKPRKPKIQTCPDVDVSNDPTKRVKRKYTPRKPKVCIDGDISNDHPESVVIQLNPFDISFPPEDDSVDVKEEREAVRHENSEEAVVGKEEGRRDASLPWPIAAVGSYVVSECESGPLDISSTSHPFWAGRKYTCNYCGKCYDSPNSVSTHVFYKHADCPQTCLTCKKVFSSRSTLLEHSKTHGEPQEYKCNMCPALFAYPFQLREHKRLH